MTTGEIEDDELNRALVVAADAGQTETVNVLLLKGADVHARDDYALRAAAWNGHAETVKVLLAAGANVHARDGAALRKAAERGHTEIVKVLAKCMEHDDIVKGEAEYASWAKAPTAPNRCPQCSGNVAWLPMVSPKL